MPSKCLSALPGLFWNEMNMVTCGLFYFRKLRSLTLLKTPLSFHMCLRAYTHIFSLSIVSFFLGGNHIWRTGWSYKSETGPFWPGLWSCFMSSLQNFAVLETGSWVWGWIVFNSGNLLDLDSLWNQPFRLYQVLLQVVDTRANRWLCSNPDVSPTERDRRVGVTCNKSPGRKVSVLPWLFRAL